MIRDAGAANGRQKAVREAVMQIADTKTVHPLLKSMQGWRMTRVFTCTYESGDITDARWRGFF